MKKHKILDKKRLMKTSTIAMSLLIATIMISTSAMSAVTSSSSENMNIEMKEARVEPKQKSIGVTDISPNLKSGPSVSMESTAQVSANKEMQPMDYWDVLLYITGESIYCAGVGADEEYIYAVEWSGSNWFYWDFEGNYQGSFTVSGASNIRDLAYDHDTGYMWGGNGGGTAWEMDLESQSVVSTITGSWQCRAIAYSEDDDTLYVSGWGDPVWNIDKTGSEITNFNLALTTGTYGFAYDRWDENAPILWVHDQGGTGSEIRAYQLEDEEFLEEEEGYYHDVTQEQGGAIAGGLCLNEWMPGTGFAAIIAGTQGTTDDVICYEGPITIPPEHDITVKKVDYPETGYATADMRMAATFRNNGNNSETFDAQMTIIKCEVSDDPLLLENFSSYGSGYRGVPAGWDTDWWKWSSTYQASQDAGLAGEVMCYKYDQYYGAYDYYDNYVRGPPVNCSGLEKVTVSFAIKIDMSSSGYFYLKYRKNSTSSWKDVTPWENPVSGVTNDWFEIGCYGFQTGGDIGSEFQFNFSYIGYYSYFNYFYMDQIRVDPCGGCAEYADIVEDITLGIGEEVTVDFPAWTPSEWQNETTENTYEEYPVSAEALIDDDIDKNNIKYKLFDLYFPWMDDVAALEIVGFGSGPAQIFEMDGLIKNVGQNDECCFKTYVKIAEIDYSSPLAIFDEDWTGSSSYYPPAGWTDIGHYYAWTYFYQSYYMPAPYGSGPVARFYYYYSAGAELISPEFDSSAAGSLEMTMAHRVYYAYGYDFMIEIRGGPTEQWAQIQPWDNPVSGNVGPEWISMDATIGIGSQSQIRFRGDGYYYDFRYWFIDNIEIIGYQIFEPEYEDQVCIQDIIPGEEQTLGFNDWEPEFLSEETTGQRVYVVQMWTDLEEPPDKNPANDLYQEAVVLDFFHDVEVTKVSSMTEADDGRAEVLFYQRIYGPSEAWNFLTSSTGLGYVCDDDWYDVEKPIGNFGMMGLSLVYPWSMCTDPLMEFEIITYEGGTSPGAEIQTVSDVIPENIINTGLIYSSYGNAWEWQFGTKDGVKPVANEDGWFSVQSTYSSMSCNLLWGVGPDGNNNMRQNGVNQGYNAGMNLSTGFGVAPEVYFQPGSQDIDVLITNLGTFPETGMTCNAEVLEFITNCTVPTQVWAANITGINLPTPLGGNKELGFGSYNFANEGVYAVNVSLIDDDDDYPNNNVLTLGVGIDDTPPASVHSVNPTTPDGDNGYYVSDVEVTMSASDPQIGCDAAGSGVNRIEYRIDGGTWQSVAGDAGTFIISQDGNGMVIEYRAVDEVGNAEGTNSFIIDMDQTVPVADDIAWEAYEEGAWWNIDLTAHATDATADMDRVEFFINDGLQEIITGTGPDYVFTIQWSETLRNHMGWFYHYDRAGNVIAVNFSFEPIEGYSQELQAPSTTIQS